MQLFRNIGAILILSVILTGSAAIAGGKVISSTGSFEVTNLKVDDDRLSLEFREGFELRVGDVVATQARSRLKVRLADGSVISIGSNAEFTVKSVASVGEEAAPQPTQLFLTKGRMGSDLTSRLKSVVKKFSKSKGSSYMVETPTATAGVRGTVFIVEQLPSLASKTTLVVKSGKVEIKPTAISTLDTHEGLKPKVLTARQKITWEVGSNTLAEPETLSASDLEKWFDTVEIDTSNLTPMERFRSGDPKSFVAGIDGVFNASLIQLRQKRPQASKLLKSSPIKAQEIDTNRNFISPTIPDRLQDSDEKNRKNK